MPKYVDGFVIPVPKKNMKEYQRIAKIAAKVWKDHGALEYFECVGDDLKNKWGAQFPKTVKCKPNETVVFSYIVFKSRAHRDKVNANVMKDPRITSMGKEMPFEVKRMVYGGFTTIVEA